MSNIISEAGGKNFRRENMCSEFKNSVQIEKLTNISLLKQYLGKQIQTQSSVSVFRQVFSRLIRLVKGKSDNLGYYHE